MSHLILNQSELLRTFKTTTTLKDIISHFEKKMIDVGEVVCRVSINELSLSSDDESRFAETSVSEIRSLEIESENPKLLLTNVLEDWKKGIPEIIKSVDKTSEKIRFQGFDSVVSSFNSIIDACQFLVESLSYVGIMLKQQGNQPTDKWLILEKNLNDSFSNLVQACENKNSSLIADILEYDLANALQNWLDWLMNEM
jgi:hypothetical protein